VLSSIVINNYRRRAVLFSDVSLSMETRTYREAKKKEQYNRSRRIYIDKRTIEVADEDENREPTRSISGFSILDLDQRP
jgi:hypothetical protein